MELFTLGEGHYTEKDIQEAARAFTGWSIQRRRKTKAAKPEFAFRPRLHDSGPKTILGKTGDLDGDDVLVPLRAAAHGRVPGHQAVDVLRLRETRSLSRRSAFAKGFRTSGLDVGNLLKAMMKSSEFYSDKAERAIVKSPVDFCVATLRQLGVGEVLGEQARAAEGMTGPPRYGGGGGRPDDAVDGDGSCSRPTSPAGTAGRPGSPQRRWWSGSGGPAACSARLSRRRSPSATRRTASSRRTRSPAGVADRLTSIFDAPLPKAKRAGLVAAAQKASEGRVTWQNAAATADTVTRLIFATPEFQFC